ncbi:MAG: hypothetical protein WC496_08265 [Phycisphaerae bacterium]|jgi:hypothetical protein
MRRKTFDLIYILLLFAEFSFSTTNPYFQIKVIDEQTGRGVPLVELSIVNDIVYYTDSAGIVAFYEPGLMDKNVWFFVKSHGYDSYKDRWNYSGEAFVTRPGGYGEIKIKRINRAERLYRITGQGIYADSVKLGLPTPISAPVFNSSVMGQDSTQALVYKNKIYWFWGDTRKPGHRLGLFKVAGAVSDLEVKGGLDPNIGINLKYFTDDNNNVRIMFPFEGDEAIWIGSPILVKYGDNEKMIVHYSRMKSLGERVEHGLAVYNDKKNIFEKIKSLDLKRQWDCPRGHAIKYAVDGVDYFWFADPYATIRVKADYNSILDPNSYQTFTCLKPGSRYLKDKSELNRNEKGKLIYQWLTGTDPIGAREERELNKAGLILPNEVRYKPLSADTNETPLLASGSLAWNDYRKKWVIVAGEAFGKTSAFGEIWYAEANDITGPWSKCWKIVTHDHYTFYNPVHHTFFDQKNGRIIYFEGTYCSMFSGTKQPTPRYDYNQIMYKLDLANIR